MILGMSSTTTISAMTTTGANTAFVQAAKRNVNERVNEANVSCTF